MRALSIRQPYAELILRGIETIEYRSRPTRLFRPTNSLPADAIRDARDGRHIASIANCLCINFAVNSGCIARNVRGIARRTRRWVNEVVMAATAPPLWPEAKKPPPSQRHMDLLPPGLDAPQNAAR